jgi:hypothetical protein
MSPEQAMPGELDLRVTAHGVQNPPVRDRRGSTETIQGLQVRGGFELIRQGSSRMSADLLEDRHQALGASPVPQVRVSEHCFARTPQAIFCRLHTGSIRKESTIS